MKMSSLEQLHLIGNQNSRVATTLTFVETNSANIAISALGLANKNEMRRKGNGPSTKCKGKFL